MLGLGIGSVMEASWQEKQWTMLYATAFVGSMAAFFCLIKLSQITKVLAEIKDKLPGEKSG